MKTANVYTVKKVKDIEGFDGITYTATLCRNGKAVADVMGCPYGGSLNFLWLDKSGEEWKTFKQFVIDTRFNGVQPEDFNSCLEMFLEDLVNDLIILRQFKRTSKNKVVFVKDDGGMFILAKEPTAVIIAAIVAKYPTCKVLNGLSDEEVLTILRPLQPA